MAGKLSTGGRVDENRLTFYTVALPQGEGVFPLLPGGEGPGMRVVA